MLYKKPRHPQRPMSWFWCVQNKHTRGRAPKRESGERGIKVKRGFREMERTGEEEGERERERIAEGESGRRRRNERSRRGERIK